MGKTSITKVCPLGPVSLRKATQPTVSVFPHPPEETPLLNTELCFPAPNVSQAGARVTTDHLIRKRCHGVSFFGHGLCLNLTEQLTDPWRFSCSQALLHLPCSLWSLHPVRTPLLCQCSPSGSRQLEKRGQSHCRPVVKSDNLSIFLTKWNPAISFLLFLNPAHFGEVSISASPRIRASLLSVLFPGRVVQDFCLDAKVKIFQILPTGQRNASVARCCVERVSACFF